MNIREITALTPVIPVLTLTEIEQAVPLARALVSGGLRVLEIALRGPVAFAAVEAIRKAVPESIVGIGSLTRAVEFAAAARVGAQFGVTPGLTPELASAAREARSPGGIGMLQTLGAWFPDVHFCATGGISRANAPDYLGLPNVACVGGTWMAPSELMTLRDWAGIESLAREAAALRKS